MHCSSVGDFQVVVLLGLLCFCHIAVPSVLYLASPCFALPTRPASQLVTAQYSFLFPLPFSVLSLLLSVFLAPPHFRSNKEITDFFPLTSILESLSLFFQSLNPPWSTCPVPTFQCPSALTQAPAETPPSAAAAGSVLARHSSGRAARLRVCVQYIIIALSLAGQPIPV
ncbi:hypothetical protein SNK03_003339 [Fusarium graminearum]